MYPRKTTFIFKVICYIFTIINISFQFFYMVLQHLTNDELGIFLYVLCVIFNPYYLIISGLISIVAALSFMFIILCHKRHTHWLDIIMFFVNIEYIIFHMIFMASQ